MYQKTGQFNFSSDKTANLAQKALEPELKNRFNERSQASIHTNKNLVFLKVVSKDERSLEAAFNSFSRLIEMCSKILEE